MDIIIEAQQLVSCGQLPLPQLRMKLGIFLSVGLSAFFTTLALYQFNLLSLYKAILDWLARALCCLEISVDYCAIKLA